LPRSLRARRVVVPALVVRGAAGRRLAIWHLTRAAASAGPAARDVGPAYATRHEHGYPEGRTRLLSAVICMHTARSLHVCRHFRVRIPHLCELRFCLQCICIGMVTSSCCMYTFPCPDTSCTSVTK
jgi:hypothetical protein